MDNNTEIKRLEEELTRHDRLYYEEDNPEIPDSGKGSYDELCNKYYELTGKKWNADKVPGAVSKKFAPVTHQYKPKSLDKVNTEGELREKLIKLAPGKVQKKYDGLTLVVYPGKQVVTRGNGETGEDVTHTGKVITEGKEDYDLPIRGEGFFLKSDWDAINEIRKSKGLKPYTNLRNAVAGAIRTLDPDPDILKYVQFRAYNILGSTLCEDDQLYRLKELGYETPNDDLDSWVFTKDKKSIDDTVEFIMNYNRQDLDYEIDGMVIKNNEPNSLQRFGQTIHHFNNAVAYKFENTGEWTKLLGIRWTVGRTGKIVPNADIQPVNILNTTVKKASIHNASMLSRKGLKKDCEVFVVKGNDIIPDIVDVRGGTTPLEEPTNCPKCGGLVTKKESKDNEGVYQLYCENADCESKTILRVVHLAQKEALNIDALAEETAQKLYDEMFIDKPTDIYLLKVEDFMQLEGFARPSAQKLYDEIQNSRTTTLAKFIFASGIPLVGKGKSEDIAKAIHSYDALIKDINEGCPKVINIRGIGKELVTSIIKYSSMLTDLREYVTPTDEQVAKVSENQLSIVVTGSFKDDDGNKIDRKSIEQMIKDAGHKPVGSVSKKTDYVLIGTAPGSKKDKAEELGIKLLHSVDELKSIL